MQDVAHPQRDAPVTHLLSGPGPSTASEVRGVEPAVVGPPRLADGVRLHGEMPGVGFTTAQWLAERNDQFVQVSALLYRVLEQMDGTRSAAEIAARVSATCDIGLEPEHIDYLVEKKLRPLGLVAASGADAGAPRVVAAPPSGPLGLNLRMRMLPAGLVERCTTVLQYAYAPAVLLPMAIAIALSHWWLYASSRVSAGIERAFYQPGAMAAVLLLAIGAGLFHELGHAAALKYGGGRPRSIGFGLYLVFPAFYSDVTDSYRLPRAARIRTDLGGIYFHLILATVLIAMAAGTGSELLLTAAILFNVEAARQFIPFVRLDGYWLLADLTGVPDFTSQIAVFRRSIGRHRDAASTRPMFKPWVAAAFGAYMLFSVPAMVYLVGVMAFNVPDLVALTQKALQTQIDLWATPLVPTTRALVALQILFVPLPFAATVYFLYITGASVIVLLGTRLGWASRFPIRRLAGATVVAGGMAVLALGGTPMWFAEPSARSADATPGTTDPLAMARRVAEATARVRSVRADLSGTMNGEPFRGSVSLARPNFAHVDVEGAAESVGRFSVHSDGRTLFVFFPEDRKYTETSAVSTGANINAFIVGQVRLFFNPDRLAAGQGGRLIYAGTERVGRRDYDVLELRTTGEIPSLSRHYVSPDDHLVYRIVTTSTRRGKTSTRVVQLENVRLNERLDVAQFTWAPPQGATPLGLDALGAALPKARAKE